MERNFVLVFVGGLLRQSQCGGARQQRVSWHHFVFTVPVKSTGVGWPRGQRPETDCSCLNILLPVRAIYNVPVHGLLSAVSNLHLQEHFGSKMDGWMVWQAKHKS